MHSYRQPSVAEAAHLVCISLTLEYRRACLKFWEEHFGDTFRLAVEREVRRTWKPRANHSR